MSLTGKLVISSKQSVSHLPNLRKRTNYLLLIARVTAVSSGGRAMFALVEVRRVFLGPFKNFSEKFSAWKNLYSRKIFLQ
jgi:hypothetical protein